MDKHLYADASLYWKIELFKTFQLISSKRRSLHKW